MKKTLSAIYLMAALPCMLVTLAAQATTVPDEPAPDAPVHASSLPRWTVSPDPHVPLNSVPLEPHATNEHKYRYLDMASVKRVDGVRRAVIVIDTGKNRSSCSPSYRQRPLDDAPEIRRPSQHARPVVVMRPMT